MTNNFRHDDRIQTLTHLIPKLAILAAVKAQLAQDGADCQRSCSTVAWSLKRSLTMMMTLAWSSSVDSVVGSSRLIVAAVEGVFDIKDI